MTGVGLNYSNDEPTTSLHRLIEMAPAVPHCDPPVSRIPSREVLLASFCNVYEGMHRELESNGFGAFREDYLRHWLHTYEFDNNSSIGHGTGDFVRLCTIGR